MSRTKRIICLLLMLVLFATAIPQIAVPSLAAGLDYLPGAGNVTRAQWIQALVNTFSMTVEEDNYPDNYYTDLTGNETYYRDILVAVEFGVIDQIPGTEFRPNEPATREFAAHTLNFALGYQLDENTAYTFKESAAVTYPKDIQVAINRKWFALSSGAFKPSQAVTAAEAKAMLEDAAKVLAGDEIDENYKSTFVYAAGVVEVPNGTSVEFSGLDTVYITYCPVTIKQGDTFVVYNSGLPVICVAETVSENEGILTVTYSEGPDDALIDCDYQTTVEADLEQFEGAQATTYSTRGGLARAGAVSHKISYNKGKKEIVATLPLNLANGIKASIELNISNLKITSKARLGQEATCIIDADTKVAGNVKVDYLKAADFPSSITIGTVKVAGVGTVTLEAEFDISGELVVITKGHVRMGFQWTNYDGFRIVYQYKKKSFEISAEISVSAGLRLTAGVDIVAATGNVWASMGETTVLKQSKFTDEETNLTCRDEQTYTYLKVGYYVSVLKAKTWSDTYTIYGPNRSNPSYRHYHYENGELVGKCTRNASSSNHYTSPSSKWFNPGSSSGSSSYTGTGGEKVVLYTYKLDDENNATITKYNGNAGSLNIPKTLDGYTVTAIGENAFGENTALYAVNIPETVTDIGNSAFFGCKNLSSVILPENLKTLGYNAFGSCTSLKEIEIPKSLKTAERKSFSLSNYTAAPFASSGLEKVTFEEGTTSVVANLFYNADKLKEVQLLDSMTSIGESAFVNCVALQNITIPESVTTIETAAFAYCTALKSVMIPDSVTSIKNTAFSGCTELSSVSLSKKLEFLGYNAFGSCTSLKEIEIPKSLKTAERKSFSLSNYMAAPFASSGLEKVTFEEGTTSVIANLFYNADKLKGVQLLDSMTSIGECAFTNCVALQNITIPESVTTIGVGAFSYCTSLKEIMIPNSVISIKDSAFSGCTNLSSVTLSKKLNYLGVSAFSGCSNLKEIQIPKSLTTAGETYHSMSNYQSAPFSDSGLEKATFEEGTASVLPYLFANADKLKQVELLDSMKSIGMSAFAYCDALESVTIPGSVTSVDGWAFAHTSALKEIVIPNGVSTIKERTFYNCPALKTVKLPETINNIEDSAFSLCVALTDINLPNNLQKLGASAFRECKALTSVAIPNQVAALESNLFYDCDALTSVTLPGSLTKIANYCFYDCDSLTAVAIPENVTTIGAYSFYDCDALKTVTMGDAVTSLGAYSFENCDVLSSVSLSRNLQSISDKTFYECAELTQLRVPYHVKNIYANAFSNSPKLTKLVLPRGLESMDKTALSYPNTTVIYGVPGTYSESWANDNGYQFVANEVAAQKVELNKTSVNLVAGGSELLKMTVTPEDFTDAITWKSSDTNVVKVDELGKLTAISAGSATVKVSVGGASASCQVTVVQGVTSVSLNKSNLTLDAGKTFALKATVRPDSAANKTLIWESSDEKIVTVDQNGTVTAVGKGVATVTATAQDGSNKKSSCKITVTNNLHIATDVSQLESPHNYTANCRDMWVYQLNGASALGVTFDEKTSLEKDFDFLYVYDAQDNVVGKYTGTDLAGKTVEVPGNIVKIQLVSDGSEDASGWGFKVTAVTDIGAHTHKWSDATCTNPKTCTQCGATEGTAKGHSYANGKCSVCGAADPNYKEPEKPTEPTTPENPVTPSVSGINRLAGSTRYKTAFAAADELKKINGVAKFDTIIVSSGEQFADALAGSYLAAAKNAPILLVKDSTVKAVKEYINANLNPGGTVYLLGGKVAVPEKMETGLDGFNVKRLGGNTRYDTNLMILKEAGVAGKDIVVCTGKDFADSLSASAVGLPILLVKDSLNSAQKEFLTGNTGKIYIIGGVNAVSEKAEKQLASYGAVTRLAGATRYKTSVLVAETFFGNPTAAVIAYGENFPDGLSGGPVAYALKSPLILTREGREKDAAAYITAKGIQSGYIQGGTTVLPEKTVNKVFGK